MSSATRVELAVKLLSEQFENLLREFEPQTEPEYLYHYCNFDTLQKILKSQSLWASDVREMNDRKEIKYAYGRLEAACQHGKYLLSIGPAAKILEQKCLTHVACLSLRADNRNQWEKYAAEYAGAAIGIRFAEMRRIAGTHLGRLFHFPMVYEQTAQSHFLNELLKVAGEIERDMLDSQPQSDVQVYRDHVILHIGAAVATLKDPSFAAEEEWRLAIDCETNEFLKVERGPICCRALPVCTPAAIGEIVLGPNSPMTIDTIRQIALDAGISNLTVRRLEPSELK